MNTIPWPEVIHQLIKSGLTQPQIASAAKCGQSTISDLLSGKTTDTRTRVGLALIKMASDRVPDFVPPAVSYSLGAAPIAQGVSHAA